MFIFITLVRATFKLIKQRDKVLRLSTQDNANQEASDSNNGKLDYHYADLIEKEKLLLQNLFKNTKIEPEEKKRKKQEIWAKINRGKKKRKKRALFKKQKLCDFWAYYQLMKTALRMIILIFITAMKIKNVLTK